MSTTVTITLDLPAHEAQDLVNMALNEWWTRRDPPTDYVEARYGACHGPAFRAEKLERITRQIEAVKARLLVVS